MKRVYIKKIKINEDDAANAQQAQQTQQQATDQQAQTPQNTQTTGGDPNAAFDALQKQVNDLKKQKEDKIAAHQMQIDQINKDFNNIMQTKRLEAQKLNNALSNAGMPNRTLQESEETVPFVSVSDIRFGKKLFESVKRDSMVDKIMNLIYSAVEGAQVSNTPTNPEVFRTYARGINRYITTHKWSEDIVPKNHWDELSEVIKSSFKNGTKFSYTDTELDRIVNKIKERFSKSDGISWIFGNETK